MCYVQLYSALTLDSDSCPRQSRSGRRTLVWRGTVARSSGSDRVGLRFGRVDMDYALRCTVSLTVCNVRRKRLWPACGSSSDSTLEREGCLIEA